MRKFIDTITESQALNEAHKETISMKLVPEIIKHHINFGPFVAAFEGELSTGLLTTVKAGVAEAGHTYVDVVIGHSCVGKPFPVEIFSGTDVVIINVMQHNVMACLGEAGMDRLVSAITNTSCPVILVQYDDGLLGWSQALASRFSVYKVEADPAGLGIADGGIHRIT